MMKVDGKHLRRSAFGALSLTGGVLAIAAALLLGVQPPSAARQPAEALLEGSQPIPPDPAVLTGRLANGLTYYIRENRQPRDRAVLRLVVNAGSVLEEEHELGLAHFVEHMAFRGTESFSRDEIIGFLEEVGMEYGPHVNAYVGFDQTVYKMRLPTDDNAAFDRGLDILFEWAHKIAFDTEAIEHERGVIEEEWRARLGSAQRVRDEQLPVILAGSRYAERLPIGDMDIVRGAPPETIRGFYERWYRPELMAIVAAGDFDAADVRRRIGEVFGEIPASDPPVSRPEYEVPEHEETRFAVVADAELSRTTVGIYNNTKFEPTETLDDYREDLAHRLFLEILNARFRRIARRSDPPFVGAVAGVARLGRPILAHYLGAIVDEDDPEGIERGLQTLIAETRRIYEHGFSDHELDRARRTLLREAERDYRRRGEVRSEELVDIYINAFLDGSPFPSPAVRLELVERFLPQFEPQEIRSVAEAYLADRSRVVTVSMIETGERRPPAEDRLSALLQEAAEKAVRPFEDEIPAAELAITFPERGEVVEEMYHEELSLHEWRLSNGATLFVRPTDFRSDEVKLAAYALGGESLAADERQLVNLRLASDLVWQSGLGEHSRSELEDLLAGLEVELRPYIDRTSHGFEGASGTDEIEQLLQLLALYFVDLRQDEEAYETVLRRKRTEIRNQEADPEFQFFRRLTELVWDDDSRVAPLTLEQLDELEMNAAYAQFRELFANPGQFTFTIVGDLDTDRLRLLVEEYLAAIPGEPAGGEVIDHNRRYASGVRRDTVRAGLAPRSVVAFVFHGEHTYTREENYLVRSLGEVLRRRMRDYLREELGAVYQSGAIGLALQRPWQRYSLQLIFATDPEEAEELAEQTLAELRRIREGELDDAYVRRTREVQRSEYSEALRENRFWLETIQSLHEAGRDLRELATYAELIEGLTTEAVIEAARRFLDMENYVQVTLLPAAEPQGQLGGVLQHPLRRHRRAADTGAGRAR